MWKLCTCRVRVTTATPVITHSNYVLCERITRTQSITSHSLPFIVRKWVHNLTHTHTHTHSLLMRTAVPTLHFTVHSTLHNVGYYTIRKYSLAWKVSGHYWLVYCQCITQLGDNTPYNHYRGFETSAVQMYVPLLPGRRSGDTPSYSHIRTSFQIISCIQRGWLQLKPNSVVWVRERKIPTERPKLVSEVGANVWG
jgi:hypothetical protein